MDLIEKKSRLGLYFLVGLIIAVVAVVFFVFFGGQPQTAPAPEDRIGGGEPNESPEPSSCPAYTRAVARLGTKYKAELSAFWRAAKDEAGLSTDGRPAATLAAVRGGQNLQNYDTELNALRAEYGLIGYDFAADSRAADLSNFSSDDHCPEDAGGLLAAERDRLRQVFDLDGHSAAVAELNRQHRLAEFVADNAVPASTAPWAPPHPDGTPGETLVNWTDEQTRAVLTDADEHRLEDYLAAVDQLYADHNLDTFEALVTDLEIRYNLSLSWLVGGGELITLTQIYDQEAGVNYFSLGHIRGLIAPQTDGN